MAVTASAATQSNAGTSGEEYEVIDYDPIPDYAYMLKNLGLFKGTDNGFELDRAPTRVEALVLLIRTLGKEDEIEREDLEKHPFTDVPAWADNYVSYAYMMGYTNGISETKFGSRNEISSHQFITFMLRALGYNDAEGDFHWSSAGQAAENLDAVYGYADASGEEFLRYNCVDIITQILSVNMKDEEITLIEYLINAGAVDSKIASDYGLIDSY